MRAYTMSDKKIRKIRKGTLWSREPTIRQPMLCYPILGILDSHGTPVKKIDGGVFKH